MQPDWDEADRLAALRGYNILDSDTEEVFEDFVRIAAHICDAPIALVSLVDEGRQWFAAKVGLAAKQTPIEQSVCAHAIRQPDVFVVPDLALDPRFERNTLVTEDPNFRFYGAAILETSQGLPLGTLCVIDTAPRPAGLTDAQASLLRALARQVMTRLELRRAVAEKDLLILEAHHRVKNSLQMVQSLLSLQAKATADPDAARQLRESALRVNTFGVMHEHLYRVAAALEVDLGAYLRSLIGDQQRALASTLDGRDIAFAGADVSWPSADAAAVGLVVMELVTNALKYGAGVVGVAMAASGDELVLTVADQGRSLPDDFEPAGSLGLGMRVLNGLLRARRGSLAVDRSRGHTCFVATLRRMPPQE